MYIQFVSDLKLLHIQMMRQRKCEIHNTCAYIEQLELFALFGSATRCASPPPRPSIFSNYSFRVYHPVNRHDRHFFHIQ
jgi:hypothetical protein